MYMWHGNTMVFLEYHKNIMIYSKLMADIIMRLADDRYITLNK